MKSKQTTSFQDRVYSALKRVPHGKVTTYRDLAEQIGCGSPRAVGQALKRNPFAPKVPCHRVISSTLRIGGFVGQTKGSEIERKLKLLSVEGVSFKHGKLADLSRLYKF